VICPVLVFLLLHNFDGHRRRRRCGNVGIRRLVPEFQARREGRETRFFEFSALSSARHFHSVARAPYLQNGSADSLQQVVSFYNERFQMGLTANEMGDLVTFLGSL
jgi:cytochrome c peroxidase